MEKAGMHFVILPTVIPRRANYYKPTILDYPGLLFCKEEKTPGGQISFCCNTDYSEENDPVGGQQRRSAIGSQNKGTLRPYSPLSNSPLPSKRSALLPKHPTHDNPAGFPFVLHVSPWVEECTTLQKEGNSF
jgi:hypothetical protein